jgi:hypothetical protein
MFLFLKQGILFRYINFYSPLPLASDKEQCGRGGRLRSPGGNHGGSWQF